MYDRYGGQDKFITDPAALELVNGCEVYLSRAEDYDIVANLEGREGEFDQLRPFLAFTAAHLCGLDNLAQKFDRLQCGGSGFPFDLTLVYVDEPHIILEYWGTQVNTQFDVVFEHKDGKFELQSYGIKHDIPPGWDAEPKRGTETPPRRGLLSKLFGGR